MPAPSRESIKRPTSVPVSPSSAVECYPCREVPLNYSDSYLFHGGNTGSIPVRDAKLLSIFEIYAGIEPPKRFLMDVLRGRYLDAALPFTRRIIASKSSLIQRQCPVAASIRSGWQRSYGAPHLACVVGPRLPCTSSQQPETLACYRRHSGGNMQTYSGQ